MTGTSWIGMLCILLLSAGLSYTAMRKMSVPLPEHKVPEANVTARPQAIKKGEQPVGQEAATASRNDWDVLWKKSLFQDDRTEDEAVVEQPDVPVGSEEVNTEFELIGLAMMGRKDAEVPLAIIVEMAKGPSRRGPGMRGPGMPGPGMPGMPMPPGMAGRGNIPGGRMPPNLQRFQPIESQDDNKSDQRKADGSLYREGDEIGKTGYKVKSIVIDESKVVLVKNGKETVLILDEKNTNNSVRRENVKRDELAAREKYKQQETTASQNANQPNANQPQNRPRFMPPGFQPGQFRPGGNFGGGPGGMQQPPNFGGGPAGPAGMPPQPPNFGGGAGGNFGGAGGNFGGGAGGNIRGGAGGNFRGGAGGRRSFGGQGR